ncbi:hypothetical protein AGLY_010858 [Aphis glycines]|uniref:Uncharacterized protein n=1 Tax=Aphis glycines TaxID=307491 RepID=A0A6G0TER9_APHGL|nr:hypothetical protein AGLY_010858 [Aphis glycines]
MMWSRYAWKNNDFDKKNSIRKRLLSGKYDVITGIITKSTILVFMVILVLSLVEILILTKYSPNLYYEYQILTYIQQLTTNPLHRVLTSIPIACDISPVTININKNIEILKRIRDMVNAAIIVTNVHSTLPKSNIHNSKHAPQQEENNLKYILDYKLQVHSQHFGITTNHNQQGCDMEDIEIHVAKNNQLFVMIFHYTCIALMV